MLRSYAISWLFCVYTGFKCYHFWRRKVGGTQAHVLHALGIDALQLLYMLSSSMHAQRNQHTTYPNVINRHGQMICSLPGPYLKAVRSQQLPALAC